MAMLDLQVRFRELGRIRAGEKGPKGEPRKRDTWRLTSASRALLEQARERFGGEVREWTDAPDEGYYELLTETDRLDVMIPPVADAGSLLSQHYELWSGGGCQRRCDGVNEALSGKPCLCDPEDRECKPTTRLSVMLPQLGGIGVWRLDSHGFNAAVELPGTFRLIVQAAEGQFMPAVLSLEQRSDKKDGQTRRYAVPVLDMEQATILQLVSGETPAGVLGPAVATGRPALPAAGEPPSGTGAEFTHDTGTPAHGEKPPLPGEDPNDGSGSAFEEDMHALNALVGSMRNEGLVTTRNLYTAVAVIRGLSPVEATGTKATDVLIGQVAGVGSDGELHWTPLRESLTPEETATLRARLGRKWAASRETAGAAA